MKHTTSSELFRQERIPSHTMQVFARMKTTMYLVGRYGARVQKHSRRLAIALERMER